MRSSLMVRASGCQCQGRNSPVPEFIYPVFAKTSPKRSFLMSKNERFGLVFAKIRSINSGARFDDPSILRHNGIWRAADEAVVKNVHVYKKEKEKKYPPSKFLLFFCRKRLQNDELSLKRNNTVKKVIIFPFPSRDVTNQPLSRRE
jgi:hypothetical protein